MEDVLDETPNWLREHLSDRNPRVRQYQRRRNEGDWVGMVEVDNDADDESDGVDFEEDGGSEASSDDGDSEFERMLRKRMTKRVWKQEDHHRMRLICARLRQVVDILATT